MVERRRQQLPERDAGSDLDGGFGTEQTPKEVETIADLHVFLDVLAKRGYSDEDLDGIASANFLRFFRENLPLESAS